MRVISWSLSSSLVAAICQLVMLWNVSNIGGEALGILALGNALILISTTAIDSGITSYVVKSINYTKKHFYSLSIICIATLIVISFILIFFNTKLLLFFGLDDKSWLIYSCVFTILAFTFQVQFQAIMLRYNLVRGLSISEILSRIFYLVLGWAGLVVLDIGVDRLPLFLASSYFLKAVIMIFVIYKSNVDIPQGADSRCFIFKDWWNYSSYLFLSQYLVVLRNNSDSILIGKIFGVEQLGIYSVGKELVSKISQFANPVFLKIYFVKLAELKRSGEDITKYIDKVFFGGVSFLLLSYGSLLVLGGVVSEFVFRVEGMYKYLVILSIIGFIRTSYFSFNYFSRINGWTKREAGISFLGLIFVFFSLSGYFESLIVSLLFLLGVEASIILFSYCFLMPSYRNRGSVCGSLLLSICGMLLFYWVELSVVGVAILFLFMFLFACVLYWVGAVGKFVSYIKVFKI